MRITFTWYHVRGGGKTAKGVAEFLNQEDGRKRWKGRSWTGAGSNSVEETVAVNPETLRGAGLYRLVLRVESTISSRVEVRIDGRNLLNHAAWADDQIRKLREKPTVEALWALSERRTRGK